MSDSLHTLNRLRIKLAAGKLIRPRHPKGPLRCPLEQHPRLNPQRKGTPKECDDEGKENEKRDHGLPPFLPRWIGSVLR
jgi:hypothetical protein